MRPTAVEDCFEIINSLVQDEGPITAVNLLMRHLQGDLRDLNKSVAGLARVENFNEATLTEVRQGSSRDIWDYLTERWRHH